MPHVQFALAGGHQTIRPYLILQVRREHIILDTMNKLALYESYDFKKPLKVRKVYVIMTHVCYSCICTILSMPTALMFLLRLTHYTCVL